jgi:D-alanyl-D-alanine carboxypeptidase
MEDKMRRINLILLVLLVISIGAAGYLGYKYYHLGKEKINLENEFSQKVRNLQNNIGSLEQALSTTTAERDDFERKYIAEKNRLDYLSSQISSIEGSVSVLEKLSQTDPELLQKYSKIYFLNENYVPRSFIKIAPQFTFNPRIDYLFYYETWPFLKDLLVSASSSGIDIKVISAFRSYGTQADIKARHLIIYGSGANSFSADQGYSEHQLGTTVDLTTSENDHAYANFEETQAYQWLLENAHKYGFILSYPENNQYYIFEPWHWRFVGRALAQRLHQEGKNFYDLDQREIDEYLISFFD